MKKLLACLLAITSLLTFTACDAKSVVDSVGNAAQAQGRQYGKTFDLKQDETLECSFFELRINSVTLADTFADATPDTAGNKFLIVNTTIKNTFEGEEPIPMYFNDFELSWEGATETSFPLENFSDEMLPDEYEIAFSEEQTGNLIFEVPGDKTDFTFVYLEYYEDEFEGNTYNMAIKAA